MESALERACEGGCKTMLQKPRRICEECKKKKKKNRPKVKKVKDISVIEYNYIRSTATGRRVSYGPAPY